NSPRNQESTSKIAVPSLVVVDDFLPDPHSFRQEALTSQLSHRSQDGSNQKAFWLAHAKGECATAAIARISDILGRLFGDGHPESHYVLETARSCAEPK